jgi:hypothetical protein
VREREKVRERVRTRDRERMWEKKGKERVEHNEESQQ